MKKTNNKVSFILSLFLQFLSNQMEHKGIKNENSLCVETKPNRRAKKRVPQQRVKNKLMGIPLKEMKRKRNLGLLERSHGLGTEISLRGRIGNSGSSVVGESAHESTNGGTLSGAGDGDDDGFNRQRLLSQPRPEPILQILEPCL